MDILQGKYYFKKLKSYSHNTKEYKFTTKNYCFLDIETAKTDNSIEISEAVGFSMCDLSNTFAVCSKYVTTQENLYNDMLELVYMYTSSTCNKLRCYYHNSTFDCTFLLIELNKRNYIQVDELPEKLNILDKYYTLIVSNNDIIELVYTYKGKVFQIWDTFKIWATSLANISSECVKLNKKALEKNEKLPFPNILDKSLDTEFDYNKTRKIGEMFSSKENEYMINDVISSSAVIKIFSFLDLKMTISATAYNECINSFIKSLYIHDSIIFMLYNMLINNTLDSVNISSLVLAQRKENTYLLYSKNYYEIYDNTTLICAIDIDNLKNKQKTTIKTLFKDNFLYIKDKIIQNIKPINPNFLHQKLTTQTLFYSYFIRRFNNNIFKLLMFFYTFNHGGSVKTSKSHLYEIHKLKQEFVNYYFPKIPLQLDKILRRAYKGGICQVNELYQYQIQENVKHIDINSSYPYKMRDCLLPYGLPNIIEGYKKSSNNTICLYEFICDYDIKNGYLASLMSKNIYGMAKMSTHGKAIEFLQNIDENKQRLYLYDCEFDLFLKHYDIKNLIVFKTYEFKAASKMFYAYNDKYYKFKQSKKGTVLYSPSKILLNSVTGKFGQNKYKMEGETVKADFSTGVLKFKKEVKEYNENEIKTYYLPVVSYCTALSRCQLMVGCDEITENGGKVFYMDTDSLFFNADNVSINDNNYLVINNNVTNILIDKNILGAWDMEHKKKEKALFICPKRYFLDIDGNGIIKDCKCAGVNNKYAKNIQFSNFKLGNTFKTMHRKKTENGVDLIEDIKQLRYSEILYKTDICTLSSTEIYTIGDNVQNIYGDICTIQDILYIPPRFEKYFKKEEVKNDR